MSLEKSQESNSYFSLQQSNTSFSARCNDAFASLEALEKKHVAYENSRGHSKHEDESGLMKSDPIDDCSDLKSHRRSNVTHNRNRSRRHDGRFPSKPFDRQRAWPAHGQRSHDDRDSDGFWPPRRRPPHRPARTIPGFQKNPEKWICYSLEDVKSADMSEDSNRRAAFEFLNERRKAREGECKADRVDVDDTVCSKGIFSFSKPKALGKKQGTDSTPSSGKETCFSTAERQSCSTYETPLYFEDDADNLNQSVKETIVNPSVSCSSDSSANELTTNSKGTSGFKARKTMRRNIRQKESDD